MFYINNFIYFIDFFKFHISSIISRISGCKFSRIGCPWRGPVHESHQHELDCAHPHRNGAEVMEALQAIDVQLTEERKLFDNIFDLLGYEKITFNGISTNEIK